MKTQDTVVGYSRYSDPNSATGRSEARQADGLIAFAQRIKAEIWPEVYCDRSRSGFHGEHLAHDFGRLLRDCKAKKFPPSAIIYFEDMDRFGRMKQRETQKHWGEILDAGYRIGVEGVIYTADTPEIQLLTPIIKAILAHEESLKKSNRVKDAWEEYRTNRKSKCGHLPGMAPGWIKWDKPSKQYVADKVKVALLNRIVRLALDGISLKQIMKRLNVAKEKPIRSVKGASGKWSTGTLSRLLRSPALIGKWQPKQRGKNDQDRIPVGEPMKLYPVVVKETDYWRLQSILKSNTGRRGGSPDRVTNLFTGVMRCEDDGSGIVINPGGRGSGKSPTLYSKATHEGLSDVPAFPYRHFEEAFLTWFKELRSADLMGADQSQAIADKQAQLAQVEARIADLHKKNIGSNAGLFDAELIERNQERLAIKEELNKLERSSYATRAAMEHKDTRGLLDMMAKCPAEELPELRQRIKGRIAQLVADIRYRVRQNGTAKVGLFIVTLKSGFARAVWVQTKGTGNGMTVRRGVMEASSPVKCLELVVSYLEEEVKKRKSA